MMLYRKRDRFFAGLARPLLECLQGAHTNICTRHSCQMSGVILPQRSSYVSNPRPFIMAIPNKKRAKTLSRAGTSPERRHISAVGLTALTRTLYDESQNDNNNCERCCPAQTLGHRALTRLLSRSSNPGGLVSRSSCPHSRRTQAQTNFVGK